MSQIVLDMKVDSKALVILSGGQDSVTCLGFALNNFKHVECIAFNYGQNHSVELEQAEKICAKLDVPLLILKTDILSAFADSALVTQGNVSKPHHRNDKLPASFVPNRNAMFIVFAHAYAQKIGAETLITGVCQTDYSGYPDCRDDFISSIQNTLNLGYDTSIDIMTPLMFLNKAETFALAEECGILDTVVDESHTCYNGDRSKSHPWGKGCGTCPACELRAKGWDEYQELKGEENA